MGLSGLLPCADHVADQQGAKVAEWARRVAGVRPEDEPDCDERLIGKTVTRKGEGKGRCRPGCVNGGRCTVLMTRPCHEIFGSFEVALCD